MDAGAAIEKARRVIRHFEIRAKRAKNDVEVRRAFRLLRHNLNRIRIGNE